MSNISEKIIKIVTNVLMTIVIIAIFFALYNFIQLSVNKNKYVSFFGYTVFDVVTGSMSGTIEINDVILVKITKDVEKGDIITYHSGDSFITHRLVEVEGDILVTKGDFNNTSDNPIDRQVVLGKVIKIIPKLGVWRKVLTTPKVLISICSTLVLFSFAFSYKPKESKKKIKKEKKIFKEPQTINVKNVKVSEKTEVLDLSSLKIVEDNMLEKTELLDLSTLKDYNIDAKTEILNLEDLKKINR